MTVKSAGERIAHPRFVIAGVVVLALCVLAGIVFLEHRASTSRDAQVQWASSTNELNELQGVPWLAGAASGGSSARVRAELSQREQGLVETLARLEQRWATPDSAAVQTLLEANFASLAQIYRYAAGGQPSATRARQVGDGAQRTLAPALHALHEVSDDYAESARTDQRESVVGSIAAVLALAAAFAFFYRRSAAAHQSLRAREQSLRATLADLERAQAERKRLLARTVEVAEQERIRVADDLHDGPIQQLTVISLRLEMLANQIASACPDAEEKLRDLRADVANEMVSLRRLMSDLRPPILDRGGLSAALQDCADKVIDTALTSCEVRSRIGGARLAAEIETVVYRVTREALVNVRKHAEATHVEVSLDRDGDDLRLVIADDGRGFESGELARRVRENHFGFLALQERIEAVGGRWRINSGAGAGTRIEALIPWKPHAV